MGTSPELALVDPLALPVGGVPLVLDHDPDRECPRSLASSVVARLRVEDEAPRRGCVRVSLGFGDLEARPREREEKRPPCLGGGSMVATRVS